MTRRLTMSFKFRGKRYFYRTSNPVIVFLSRVVAWTVVVPLVMIYTLISKLRGVEPKAQLHWSPR